MNNESWRLSKAALDRFLAALDPDPTVAAERYEQIRLKLLRFFEWRGADFPEAQVDETLTRVIRKLDEGEPLRDAGTYCYGVARLVLLERRRLREREREAAAGFHALAGTDLDAEVEHRLACLRPCLAMLSTSDRHLIAEYYRHERPDQIAARRRLGATLGIGLNALRIRAHRLRERLASCVSTCLQRKGL
ncbi:MAG: hypothetical protein AB7P99_16060 [Vicinamibacterales bacterium]